MFHAFIGKLLSSLFEEIHILKEIRKIKQEILMQLEALNKAVADLQAEVAVVVAAVPVLTKQIADLQVALAAAGGAGDADVQAAADAIEKSVADLAAVVPPPAV